MIVTTGFGYYTKDGKVIMKYELPIGVHPDPEGLTQVEVLSAQSLAEVQVDHEAMAAYRNSIQ